jgi:tetratricopeptide (TPR) repeat protein
MIISVITFGQNSKSNSLEEIEVIPPTFPEAELIFQGKNVESINDYLSNNIEFPQMSVNCGLQGTEVIQFIVTPKGELTDFNVINSVCSEIDREVIRILEVTSGLWKPAHINGEPVAMVKEVSLAFKLNEKNDFRVMAKKFAKQGDKMLFIKKDPKRALKYYDMGITLSPNEESLLATRGLCKYELGDEEGARRDWNRIPTLKDNRNIHFEPNLLTNDFRELSGFAELKQILEK